MYRHDPAFGQRPHRGSAHRPPTAATGGVFASRKASIVALSAIILLSGWAGAASVYLFFHDEALRIVVEKQVAMTRAHHAQITEYEVEIERLHSLKLIDQERVDRAILDIVRRQSALERRHSALQDFYMEGTDSVRRPEPRGATDAAERSVPAARPKPVSDVFTAGSIPLRSTRLEPDAPIGIAAKPGGALPDSAIGVRLATINRELITMETAQDAVLHVLERHVDRVEQKMRGVFADLGMSPSSEESGKASGSGGPFVPWSGGADDDFDRRLHRMRISAQEIEALDRKLAVVPVRLPVSDASQVTSGFGMRVDPFMRQLAMHSGIDFGARTGDGVHATAAGTVVVARRNGGYGLMVEIDHGNGLTTRYAHLSEIDVRENESVVPGDIIGRAGSTGRSTGPHLHYEVHINGEAVDPQKFLHAGMRLQRSLRASVLRRLASSQ